MGGRFSSVRDDESVGEFFADMFDVKEEIGRGSCGVVRRCVYQTGLRRLRRNRSYAVKVIPTNSKRNRTRQAYSEEARVGRLLRNIHIPRLYAEFVAVDYHYMVFELVIGENLFADLCHRTDYYELDAKNYIDQILGAVQFCHSHGIVHRDLEPGNIMLDKPFDMIKLIDFGSARRTFPIEKSLRGRCGLAMYMAPEMIRGKSYGKSVDLWSCGIIFYNMLTGRHPFPPPYTKHIFKHILKSDSLEFSLDDFEGVSSNVIDFIKNLTNHDEDKRLSAAAALEHRFLLEPTPPRRLPDRTLQELRNFHGKVWGESGTSVDPSVSYYGNYDGDHYMMGGESSRVTQIGELLTCEIDGKVLEIGAESGDNEDQ